MKTTLLLLAFCLFTTLSIAQSPAKDNRFFETRIYYCETGRLDALLARFRNHTTKLFEKHGMTNIGYWVATDVPDKLVYIMAYPSREARDKSWKNFIADPEWNSVKEASEKDGKIVAKIESIFMNPTDFSPIK
jgi:uncharacterized protein YbaA (DUF1428 family)